MMTFEETLAQPREVPTSELLAEDFRDGAVVQTKDGTQYRIANRGTTTHVDSKGRTLGHSAAMTLVRVTPKVRGKAARKAMKRARHA